MLTNFSHHAHEALALAQEEADRLGHDHVGTGHLLLGLLRLDDGGALEMLAAAGTVTKEEIESEVERLLSRSHDENVEGFAPYTPRMRHALVLAGREAHYHHRAHVGSEQLLLGLFQEAEGIGGRALRNLGFELGALETALPERATVSAH